MGILTAESGNYGGAEEQYRMAVQFNPHNGTAIMGLANALLREGDLDGAATQYERLMQVYQMQSNFDPKLAAAAEMVIAARLIGRGDTAGALAAIQQASQWDPRNPQIAEMIERASATTYPATNTHAAP